MIKGNVMDGTRKKSSKDHKTQYFFTFLQEVTVKLKHTLIQHKCASFPAISSNISWRQHNPYSVVNRAETIR